MASYYGMQQWYQSRRSSAAHRKIENENEMEIDGSNFSNSTGSTKAKDIFDTKSRRNNQVSIQSVSSKLYGKYKLYSAVELDDRRDRGLCLWCDEFWYIGHDCCKKKKFYVFDIDVDDAFEVNENVSIESQVDVTFVDENESHCKKNLMEDCVENESNVLNKITCDVETENRELSEVLGKHYEEENKELQVFDKMCEKNTIENIAENGVVFTRGSENEKLVTLEVALKCMTVLLTPKELWLYDEGSGNLMDIVVTNQLLKLIGALFSRLSILEGFNQSWIAWPELPVPPPEPPPTLIWA